MKIKNYLLMLVCIVTCFITLTCTASAEIAGGNCGTNAIWSLDEDGTLTISGTGNMTDFTTTAKVEWSSYRSDITKVVVQEGITSLGKNAFRSCGELSEVSLPVGLNRIGVNAFRDCISLENITIPDTVTTIDDSAFRGCEALTDIKISNGLEYIGTEAFAECVSLTQIKIPKTVEEMGDEVFADCDDIIITVYYNSPAMNYCVDYGYNYAAICTADFYSDAEVVKTVECSLGESVVLPQNTDSKEGYDFVGWETNSQTYNADDSVLIEGNMVFNAVWELQTFDIIFETNGGTNPQPIIKNYGESITLPFADKEGYNHIGWSPTSDSSVAEYKAGDTFSLNADTVLYAVWEMKTYTIKFDANGGVANIADHTKRYWEKLQITDVIPTMPGSTFMGWGIDAEAVVARYQPGDLLSENADITLYAVWKTGITSGDADNDGNVNISDLMFMIKRINNYNVPLTDDNKTAMDVFKDTYFNVKDILKMAQFLAGWSNVILGE